MQRDWLKEVAAVVVPEQMASSWTQEVAEVASLRPAMEGVRAEVVHPELICLIGLKRSMMVATRVWEAAFANC